MKLAPSEYPPMNGSKTGEASGLEMTAQAPAAQHPSEVLRSRNELRGTEAKSPQRPPELLERIERIARHDFFKQKSEAFQKYLAHIPDGPTQGYLKRIESALVLAEKSPVNAAAQVDGVLFELSRIARVVQQGLEQIDPHQALQEEVAYRGYDTKEQDFSEKRLKPKKSMISSDVPIIRLVKNKAGEEEYKPYVYETKCYPRMVYGASAADRNQVLKYQQAIEDGRIAGATVEIAGRVDPAFLTWLIGESIIDRGAAPDIDIIYSLELPSGSEYRLVLNGGQHQHGLHFSNEQGPYTRDDMQVISGIFASVLDHSIIDILTSNEVKDPSDTLRPLLDDPYTKITSLPAFNEYTEGRKTAMQQAFQKKAEEVAINDKNERSSVEILAHSEQEQETAIGQIFDHLQHSLEHDPGLKQMRDRYAVQDPAIRQEIIEVAHAMVRKVGTYETERAASSTQPRRPGYRGKPEGVALMVDSIVFDAVYNVLRGKKGEQPRSYDQPERFTKVTPDNIMDYLATQNRTYHTCEVYDPVTDTSETFVGDGTDEARRPIEKRKVRILEENERRLKEAFAKTLATHHAREQELEEKVERTAAEAHELRQLAGRSNTLLREIDNLEKSIEARKEHLKALSKDRGALDKELKKASPEAKPALLQRAAELTSLLRQRSEESRQTHQRAQERINALRKQMIGTRTWNEFEIRVVSEKIRNLIKFIYVITADGEAILCEEVVKGNSRKRATHSEVARGRNVYGAGEIVFEKVAGAWIAKELNNGSGHYRPGRLTLPYVTHVVGKNIDLADCEVQDVLTRGISVPEYNAILQA